MDYFFIVFHTQIQPLLEGIISINTKNNIAHMGIKNRNYSDLSRPTLKPKKGYS